MKIDVAPFRVAADEAVDLKKRATRIDPFTDTRDSYQALLSKHVAQLSELQQVLYAAASHAVLIVFQAMDAAGKDGAIRHVMSGVNPQGCQVFSFKQPSGAELKHDFLWRAAACLPERGRIGIFNRSYYEEVLVVRVHPGLLGSEAMADERLEDDRVWHERYRSISNFERHLHANGTRIIKIFLHLSKEEQRLRLLSRIDEPEKNWKFAEADVEERQFWKQYRHAYEKCLSATSTEAVPWFIVPADDKETTRLVVSQIVVDTLGALGLAYPTVSAERAAQLQAMRAGLAQ